MTFAYYFLLRSEDGGPVNALRDGRTEEMRVGPSIRHELELNARRPGTLSTYRDVKKRSGFELPRWTTLIFEGSPPKLETLAWIHLSAWIWSWMPTFKSPKPDSTSLG